MSKPDPSSVIGIAIALAALKHKPRDQLTASYILDLQSRFPLECIHSRSEGEGETGTDGTSPESGADKWRARALELEKELEVLKAQRDADQRELQKLRHDVSRQKAVEMPCEAPPKKKTKKNSREQEATSDQWNWRQLCADWSSFLDSQYPPPSSVVASYTSLKGALVSPNDDRQAYISRLTDAIMRTFKVLHVFLFSSQQDSDTPSASNTLVRPPSTTYKNLNSARVAMASPLLLYTLRSCLPVLLSTQEKLKHPNTPLHVDTHRKNLDVVLDQLLESILLPLLRSFVPLCHLRLEPLIMLKKTGKDKGKGKDKGAEADSMAASRFDRSKGLTDCRKDVFTLLGTSISALESLPSGFQNIAAEIRERLGLEAIRALEALYAAPSRPSTQPLSHSPSQPQPQCQPNPPSHPTQTDGTTGDNTRAKEFQKSRAERVRALAVKDAGWYLCCVLNLCVPQNEGKDHERLRGRNGVSLLLRDALIDGVGRLVLSVATIDADRMDRETTGSEPARSEHGKWEVDAVCQGMLLAVCERAMSGYAEI